VVTVCRASAATSAGERLKAVCREADRRCSGEPGRQPGQSEARHCKPQSPTDRCFAPHRRPAPGLTVRRSIGSSASKSAPLPVPSGAGGEATRSRMHLDSHYPRQPLPMSLAVTIKCTWSGEFPDEARKTVSQGSMWSFLRPTLRSSTRLG
jgi:hypothetical protein